MGDFDNRKKELAKNTTILTIGRACTQGINFLLLPLYTALLEPTEYGIVDLINTYVTLLIPLVNLQYDQGLFRFMLDQRGDDIKQKNIFSSVFTVNIIQCLIYAFLFTLVQPLITSQYKIFLAIDVVINVLLNTMLQFARGLGHSVSYSIASFLSAGFTVVLNVIFIAGFRMGAVGLFLGTMFAQILALFYLFVSQKIWKYYSPRRFDRKLIKMLNSYSLPLVPTQLSWWILTASDRTIVTNFLGIAQNGIYSVANKFSTFYMTFYNIFNLAWTELVALHINDDDSDEFFSQMVNTVFSICSSICLVIIAVMPFAYPLLIDDQYASGYNHSLILMVAAFCQVVCGLYSVIYLAVKKSKEASKTAFFAAVINIAVDLILIRFVGLYAASISTLVAYALMAVYRYFDSKKHVKMNLNKRLFVSTMIVLIIVLSCAIYNNIILNAVSLIIAVIYALRANKELITASIKEFKKWISAKNASRK